MNALVAHANSVSDDAFGALTEDVVLSSPLVTTPVLATPAVALGVAVTAAAFHAGYMVGIARAMAEGTHPLPK
jgi:hypothetical protein